MTAPDHKSNNQKLSLGSQPTFDERMLRLMSKSSPWVFSAIVHAILIGLLLQMSGLTPPKENKVVNIGLKTESKQQLDEGRGEDLKPAPALEPVLDPTDFEWDENQTASNADLEEVAADNEMTKLMAIAGSFGTRSKGGRAMAIASGGGTKGSETAVELALEWLQRHQNPSGAWTMDYTKWCYAADQCEQVKDPLKQIEPGLTGLATLAYLGAGYTSEQGRFQETVDKALHYLINIQSADGGFGPRIQTWSIYNQAICTLAMCEAYGMTKDPRLKQAAQKGIDFILRVRHVDGGWGYMRADIKAYRSDVSVTGWQVMALKSAQMAGLNVPEAVWKTTIDFIDSASNRMGLSAYTPGDMRMVTPHNPSTIPVGLLCRQFSPQQPDPEKAAFITELMTRKLLPSPEHEGFYYYAYYGSLCLYQYGGPKWKLWNAHVRDQLVKMQNKEGCESGSWDPGDKRWGSWAGRIYTTSLAALTLEVYYRYLPVHRGYVAETPEAAVLSTYKQALEGYRNCIELSDSKTADADTIAKAQRQALDLLLQYREQAQKLKLQDARKIEAQKNRLAATSIRLATLYMRTGQYARCAREVKDFGEQYPQYDDQKTPRQLYVASLALLSNKLEQSGQDQQANKLRRAVVEENYRKIVRDPDQPLKIYLQVADDCFARQDWWRAAEIYGGLLQKYGSDPQVRKNRAALMMRYGESLLKAGQATQALDVYEKLNAKHQSVATLEGLAGCYVQTRQFDEALQTYLLLRQGVKAGSNAWWQAEYNVAKTLMLQGNTEKCRDLIERQQKLRPSMGGTQLKKKFEDLRQTCDK